jgi:type IV pilus modification protein PilV
VILSVGLLGIFAMQSRALMDNQDAYLRTQAVALAYDMADRIRANADYWKSMTDIPAVQANAAAGFRICSAYDPSNDPSVMPDNCSQDEMTSYDVRRITAMITTLLPSGLLTLSNSDDVNTVSPDTDIITITISWRHTDADMQERQGDASFSMDVRL